MPAGIVLHPVPSAIVDVIPAYRDYDFFVVRDEVVIVEPRSHQIVDVIERGGTARAQATTTRKLHLTEKQRVYLREHARVPRVTTGTTTAEIIEGEEVPSSVEIESFPEDVYQVVPEVREYRYIRQDGDIYLVEPGDRRVIEEIR